MDAGIVALMIPIVALAIPIVAIMTWPLKVKMAQNERAEARKLYERIAMEKLDVIKTAVAMGYNDNDLAHLDERLEKLVGKDQLEGLLGETPWIPGAGSDLRDTDLSDELDKLRSMKRKQKL